MIRAPAAALALGLLCLPALAEEAPVCPPGAVQHLWDLRFALSTGQQVEPNLVYQTAVAGITQCPDNYTVQGQAADILTILGNALPAENLDAKFDIYSRAYEAAMKNDALYQDGAAPVVKKPDGSDEAVYSYNAATAALKKSLVPGLADLAVKGKVHAIFSGAPLTACPHPRKLDRVRDEAEGLSNIAKAHPKGPEFDLARARLEALLQACPAEAPVLTYHLGLAHDHRAEALMFNIVNQAYGTERMERAAQAAAQSDTAAKYFDTFISMEKTRGQDKYLTDFAVTLAVKAKARAVEARAVTP
ncbi:MAG: hypothetical protein KDA53_02570 [Hyphomonas sp.]|nr:hypothetical protein [Hyphomonas sp.]